jgi:hypothetical protein
MAWSYRGRKEVAEAVSIQVAPLSVIRYTVSCTPEILANKKTSA